VCDEGDCGAKGGRETGRSHTLLFVTDSDRKTVFRQKTLTTREMMLSAGTLMSSQAVCVLSCCLCL